MPAIPIISLKQLRLLVDLTWLLADGVGGGIKPAILDILRWLAAQEKQPLQFVYITRPDTHAEVMALARPADVVIAKADFTADLAVRLNCDVVYSPFGITECACPSVPTITLVVDLLHCDFPATLSEPQRIIRERQFGVAVKISDRFQVISDYTATRLKECYAVPAERIFRTHLPVQSRLTLTKTRSQEEQLPSINRPFFFYPANTWVHKNHEIILVAYAIYAHATQSPPWPLILTGHEDTRRQLLRELARTLQIESHIIFAGYVPDDKLAGYYRSAGALVYPSLHEGFGIPLIEAMALGTPILSSNSTAIPEVTGSAALLVNCREPATLATALENIANDQIFRDSLIEKGRIQLASFSRNTEFSRLLEAIVSVANNPAKYRRTGYYSIDGLIDPVAIFALPVIEGPASLTIALRELPADRTLQIFCGNELLEQHFIHANRALQVNLTFYPQARAITLLVPDASSLSPTDPRTHGVLLESLRIGSVNGPLHDLLAAEIA